MKSKTIALGALALLVAVLVISYVMQGAPDPGSSTEAAGTSLSMSPETADLISGKPQTVPVPGMVTMVDLGAHSCVPCKMMAPIIKEVAAEYEGRAAIVFLDVWQHPEITPKFNLRAIPTQIFYDAEGKERYRHEGFMGKEDIVKTLKRLGVE